MLLTGCVKLCTVLIIISLDFERETAQHEIAHEIIKHIMVGRIILAII